MKQSHREILDKIEKYLERPGSIHLRFFQAIYNMGLVIENKRFNDKGEIILPITLKDDYNISDATLLKRLKNDYK